MTTSQPSSARRDLGSWALAVALCAAVLGLAVPSAGVRTITYRAATPVTETAFDATGPNWPGLAGVLLLVVALAARWRCRAAPALTLVAAGWLTVAGVLNGLSVAARSERMQALLAPLLPGGYPRTQVEVVGSWSPSLLVAAGVLAALSTVWGPPAARPPRAAPTRKPADEVQVWRMK